MSRPAGRFHARPAVAARARGDRAVAPSPPSSVASPAPASPAASPGAVDVELALAAIERDAVEIARRVNVIGARLPDEAAVITGSDEALGRLAASHEQLERAINDTVRLVRRAFEPPAAGSDRLMVLELCGARIVDVTGLALHRSDFATGHAARRASTVRVAMARLVRDVAGAGAGPGASLAARVLKAAIEPVGAALSGKRRDATLTARERRDACEAAAAVLRPLVDPDAERAPLPLLIGFTLLQVRLVEAAYVATDFERARAEMARVVGRAPLVRRRIAGAAVPFGTEALEQLFHVCLWHAREIGVSDAARRSSYAEAARLLPPLTDAWRTAPVVNGYAERSIVEFYRPWADHAGVPGAAAAADDALKVLAGRVVPRY